MGDAADDAMDNMMDMDDLQEQWLHEGDDDFNEIMQDYDGTIFPSVFSRLGKRPRGQGKCPKCGGKTHLVKGRHGMFYGCDRFPHCKGSRDA